jgi:hypothetical protein
MSASTLLLYVKATGHVLAALTQAAPGAAQKPDPFAGSFLPVRYVGDQAAPGYATAQVFIPLQELDIFSDDSQKVQIAFARQWAVAAADTSGNKQLNALNASSKITSAQFTVTSAGGGSIAVKAGAATDQLAVWVRMQPELNAMTPADPALFGTSAQTVSGTTSAATATMAVPAGLPAGKYKALILAAGCVPRLETFSVS